MTIQEHKAQKPFLTLSDDGTKVALIPHKKFGYTEFPVTEQVVKKVKDEAGNEREELEDVLKADVAFVTAEEYEGLLARTHCWSGNTVVKYVEPDSVKQARAQFEQAKTLERNIAEAKQWLSEHDYVGTKIASAFLTGTDEEIAALKLEYADVIAEAKAKRVIVNDCEQQLQAIDTNTLVEVLNNEN